METLDDCLNFVSTRQESTCSASELGWQPRTNDHMLNIRDSGPSKETINYSDIESHGFLQGCSPFGIRHVVGHRSKYSEGVDFISGSFVSDWLLCGNHMDDEFLRYIPSNLYAMICELHSQITVRRWQIFIAEVSVHLPKEQSRNKLIQKASLLCVFNTEFKLINSLSYSAPE